MDLHEKAKVFWETLVAYYDIENDEEFDKKYLNAPANDQTIEHAEKHFGVKFPEFLCAVLKVHNGQYVDFDEPDYADLLPSVRVFLSTTDMIKVSKFDYDAEDDWDAKWVPLTWTEDHKPEILVLDYSQGPKPQMSEVYARSMRATHESGSFEAWADALVHRLGNEVKRFHGGHQSSSTEARPAWMDWAGLRKAKR